MLLSLVKGIFGSIRRIIFSFLGFIVMGLLFMWWANNRVSSYSEPFIYKTVEAVPFTKAGLVPGTAPTLKNGHVNLYFRYRIQAAVKLWKTQKIKYIIVSGDNGTKEYNEPVAMQKALIKAGIPKKYIILDYAGFRTLDSVIRARDIFGQRRLLFISQEFHNERAIYIGRHSDMDIIAFNAQDPPSDDATFTGTREWFARVKMMLDVHLLETAPKFLGEQIKLD